MGLPRLWAGGRLAVLDYGQVPKLSAKPHVMAGTRLWIVQACAVASKKDIQNAM